MNKPLQKRLIRLLKKDQEMRSSETWDPHVDVKNTDTLKKIIQEFGWPDETLVGKKGAEAAWLIAQHADHDVPFQKICLKLMKQKKTNVSQIHIAYLTDRLCVNVGKKQKYGTQFYLIKNKTNFSQDQSRIKKTLKCDEKK